MPLSTPAAFRAALALAVTLHAGLALHAARATSSTFDETHYVAGGLLLAREGRLDLVNHPRITFTPLAGLAVAAPLLALEGAGALEPFPRGLEAHAFLDEVRRREPEWLLWARIPSILLGAALVLALGLAARRIAGEPAGGAAALLAASEPNLVGHAALAATDAPLAATSFLSSLALARLLRTGRAADALLLGAALAAAAGYKLTAAASLGPTVALLLVFTALRAPTPSAASGLARRLAPLGRPRALAAALALTLALGAAAFLGCGLLYGPARFPSGLLETLRLRAAILESERFPYFFLGSLRDAPSLALYPVALLVKTPLPLLLLATEGLATLTRDLLLPPSPSPAPAPSTPPPPPAPSPTPTTPTLPLAPLLLPAPFLLLALLLSPLSVGMRYLLPALPAAILLAALGVRSLSSRGRAGSALAAALLAWQALSTLASAPHHLAFFHALAGGPEGGRRLLGDSNLDWGQDLPGLAAWLRERGAAGASVGYFGRALPASYGIENRGWAQTPEGRIAFARYAAISVTHLQGVFFPPGENPYRLFVGRPRVATIGGTIDVFDAEALGLRAAAAEGVNGEGRQRARAHPLRPNRPPRRRRAHPSPRTARLARR